VLYEMVPRRMTNIVVTTLLDENGDDDESVLRPQWRAGS